jgi:hypothetical protein
MIRTLKTMHPKEVKHVKEMMGDNGDVENTRKM